MTREDFVRGYATRSGFSDQAAKIGVIDFDGIAKMVALPCACGDETCEGWAMVTAESVLHHLFFCTPEPLRSAYVDAVGSP